MKKILFLLLSLNFIVSAQDLSVEDIINNMDANRTYKSAKMDVTLTIKDRWGTRKSVASAYSQGKDDMLMEFTSNEEAGQKVLRKPNTIYLYYPDNDDLVTLKGSALRQSMFGSDVSYEDMTSEKNTLDDYTATLEGTEEIDGQQTYKVKLVAKKKNLAYPVKVLNIDQNNFVTLKAQYYTRSERLLKIMTSSNIVKKGDIYYAKEQRIEDKMKRGTYTIFSIDSLDLDYDFSENFFSIQQLRF